MPSPEPATRRLFIGLGLPDSLAQRLVRQVGPTLTDDDQRLPEGVRLCRGDDLHLTLCFLGDFPEDGRPALERALAEEVRGLSAPELHVRGTGGFPDLVGPRVLWAAVEEADGSEGRLAALHSRAQQAATLMGWRPSAVERWKPFRPHVTLARVRRMARGTAAIRPAFGRLAFDHRWLPVEVGLFESRPHDPAQRYHALQTVPLVVRPR